MKKLLLAAVLACACIPATACQPQDIQIELDRAGRNLDKLEKGLNAAAAVNDGAFNAGVIPAAAHARVANVLVRVRSKIGEARVALALGNLIAAELKAKEAQDALATTESDIERAASLMPRQ